MGMYKYVRELWKKPKENLGDVWQKRQIEWRNQPATQRIDRPTRIDRARSLGYRAKPGFILIRERILGGGRQRPQIRSGRRSKHATRRKDLKSSYHVVAEQRAERAYPNCTALNSYFVGKDGIYYWYEVILVDRNHPQIISDPKINWICNKRGRSMRGITSAARKSRGIKNKGKGSEHLRPSRAADFRRRNN